MNFTKLTDYLGKTLHIHLVSNCADWEIQDVALLDNRQLHYNKNTLYFGYYEQLGQKPGWPPQSIIAVPDISDTAIESLGFVTDASNIALVLEQDLFALFNQTKNVIETTRSSSLYEELTSLAAQTKSLDSVLNSASIHLGNSLIFSDMSFKIIASSTSIPVTDPIWKENIRQGYCSYEFISAVKELEPVKNASLTTDAIEVSCSESPYRKLSSKVFHNGVQIGFLLMIEGESLFMPSHREMLSTVSHAVSYTITRYMPDLIEGVSPYQQVLYDLLIGTPSKEVLPTLSKLVFPSRMAVAYLRPAQYLGRRHLKEHTSRQLKTRFPGSHVAYHQNGIAALLPLKNAVHITGGLLQELKEFADTEHIRIGISNAFSNMESFVMHYEQAYAAMELGQKFSAQEIVYYYLDYQIFDLFSETKNPETLGRFCHPALALLRQYDHKNNTQLYHTLQVFLHCTGSIKLASQQLFIHRNSLVYRLNRITEVCQINLEDPDTCLLLRLSYLIDQYNGL
ncbi:helix-turn-helix domain-containing protein [Bariatricus massiliensis]|uniref:Helix-turn-helix domain-containing protein n=1 Tax=Bariatricus massiliensis TaxID=1745713 RepID=A0ABS8DMD9_9FIRM|nr:helix-turn-helix domain-containing protein [Bariatricus massiliensis]MCB7304590.1 helix-turn-helix domain-containing protein [Bariatricus massiliensis]MCB7374741.1 helix-turn-helix domain-containing protein [Bariatricus massiliensis]MCB7389530.1 helix-turn-helix domain-containing protein [Bariatricus massiliensis]MCB7411906.1 helix-turn-helix domain-containing protein [Bariatricus massiliensis]MCQ5254303.1 helix-turn-helix domain-containing protein [Bariatricus massiliensis]